MKTKDELLGIYNDMNDSEKHGLGFGLFPIKVMALELDSHELAELMKISQDNSGVVY